MPERLGLFRARFDDTGAVAELVDDRGTAWFDSDHVAGRFVYLTYDATDYDTWVAEYCRDVDANAEWALPDQTRLGLRESSATARHTDFAPRVSAREFSATPDADVVTIHLTLPDEAISPFGAPQRLTLVYRFSRSNRRVDLSLTTHGKRATRLPEASLLAIVPAIPGRWTLDKLGTEVDPQRVVRGGARRVHAVDGLRFTGDAGALTVTSLDAPVVALGKPELLRFDRALPDPEAGAHVILHDNLWPTNFPQWFEDDLTYRFRFAIA
ncbi:hypothetical protein GCM10025867_17250 [Frondihabitans sucicola]|uniref:Uncharacterized protein n=1 Tax=Frondihabitans sucicola TaxID=1268041 RepID=A0ABM8GM45_9MICO|nr:hypothetical protein GCM10025867_17250 [Frondihabitans sucicola]